MILLPRIYAIVDAGLFPSAEEVVTFGEELLAGGCTLLQYRNKSGNARVMLGQALLLRGHSRAEPAPSPGSGPALSLPKGVPAPRVTEPHGPKLIMNDRADLCLAAEFDGVHVGQDDLSPEAVRGVIGPERWLGVWAANPDTMHGAGL